MKLKKVNAIPTERDHSGKNKRLLQDFLERGYKIAEVEIDENQKPRVTANALRVITRQKNMPIRVVECSGKIYLKRTDV